MPTPRKIDLEIPDKFEGLFKPYRYKVFHGGRGGAKSWTFATALVILAIQKPLRILCGREFQRSISDSVHSLLSDVIARLGVGDLFVIKRDAIEGVNGSRFVFSGFRHNIQSVKSKEGIDIVWCEEANTLSRESLDVLVPTVRKPGSELWFSFNCDSVDDPVYSDFVVNTKPDSLVEKVSYYDNPWFPEVLRREMEWDKAHDTDKYLHVWEGEPRRQSHAQVFAGRWRVADFERPDKPQFFHGADWGFSVDPTALVRLFVVDNTLYIDREVCRPGVDLDDIPEFFDQVMCDTDEYRRSIGTDPRRRDEYVRRARQWEILADSARPDTISYLRKKGFNIRGAKKTQIRDGIEHMKSFDEIVVHPSCKHAIYELQSYSYVLNRLTGEPTPDLEDKNNHIIDSCRYALSRLRKGRSGSRVYTNVVGI